MQIPSRKDVMISQVYVTSTEINREFRVTIKKKFAVLKSHSSSIRNYSLILSNYCEIKSRILSNDA